MDLDGDLDTLEARVHSREMAFVSSGFGLFGLAFLGMGIGMGVFVFAGQGLEAMVLPGVFSLVGSVFAIAGGAGLSTSLRAIEVKVELHELVVDVRYGGVRIQHFTAPLSDLETVERDEREIRLRGPGQDHRLSLRDVSAEDADALFELFSTLVAQRDAAERQPPAELVAMIQRSQTT
ncbi:MAG: hypothetical protein EP330_07840 [Deltaproteobacteria bacterium]|nr:MAG: hypothetical protein EP330_07840 [Deltaproteobacteria bacterium]